ncbi:MAG: NUDIX domain-containing protein [Gammaproteobacteria bacterium]
MGGINLPLQDEVQVVAGVIRGSDGKILICLRPKHLDQGGFWEFPGGKREPGERRFEALRRELKEELDIEITRATPLLRLSHEYSTKTVELDVWDVSAWRGHAKGAEGQLIEWVSASALENYNFPAANRTIIKAARLSRVIFTMPDLAASPTTVSARLKLWFDAGARCFVMDSATIDSYLEGELLAEISDTFPTCRAKLVVLQTDHRALKLAGVGSDSAVRRRRDELMCTFIDGNVCRNAHDVERAESSGAELILIGPVGSAGSEPEENSIDWGEAARLAAKTSIPVYAFGGLRPEDVQPSIKAGCQGVILGERVWSEDPLEVMNSLGKALRASEFCGD